LRGDLVEAWRMKGRMDWTREEIGRGWTRRIASLLAAAGNIGAWRVLV